MAIVVVAALLGSGAPTLAAPGVGKLGLGTPPAPALQAHPLPPRLAAAANPEAGDYFDRIEPTLFGYLVWSRFPIRIYVESPPGGTSERERQREAIWQEAVEAALEDWAALLPLERVAERDGADISILFEAPSLRITRDPETGRLQPRARAGETRYAFFTDRRDPERPHLAHRMEISLAPKLSRLHVQATARHELGHAFGIWGHSTVAEDALYPKQVREPGPLSDRDINTLIRLYQQPTRLGWPLPSLERSDSAPYTEKLEATASLEK